MKSQFLFDQLSLVTEETWCNYLFEQDLLVNRISPQKKSEFMLKAIQCGKNLASDVIRHYGNIDVINLTNKLCKINHIDKQNIQGQIFLASFSEPNHITIYDEPVMKLSSLDISGINYHQINQIIIAHELFHYLEAQNCELYTHKAQIELWHLFGYHHYSTVRAVSEIAAMLFSWKLNKIEFSPLILNLLVLYCYNPEAAKNVLYILIANSKNKES